MQAFTILALAAAAIASPLEARNYGSCPSSCQYSCSANAVANVLVCDSVANGNQISVPVNLSLRRDTAVVARWGQKHETCCKTDAILNILTCTDLLDGNSVSVPITAVLGWL